MGCYRINPLTLRIHWQKRFLRGGWVLLLAPLLLLLGFGGWTLISEEERSSRRPPTPEWVDPQGRVDLSRFPTRIGVVDSTGQHVGWIDLREEPFWLVPPPPGTPAPCRYKVRDDQGRLIGYLSSGPDGETGSTQTHGIAPEPMRASSHCPGPLQFYPLSTIEP
ncbi:hypothetical protein HRbin22_02130 [Candidatus Thermoflexus japonica]|uniref:Uncharacterized protein n=1 Tax=Candidatus Thermoflexus japonica TaxID=2035417 RepID=A0A2H5Y916_9CHLR|nr:hypothetical protein HRbin22_02130 [Candidatus Thermoflexus japonica]